MTAKVILNPYAGRWQAGERKAEAEAALQEDVDAIGVSILSGAHNYLLSRIMELLKEKDILRIG